MSYFIRPGSGETILYLHGMGSSKHDFLGAVDIDVFRDHTLIAFDFPGCGNTAYPEGLSLGVDDLAEITNELISCLNLNNLVLVGHSLGGVAGLLFAHKYRDRVRKFINVEGNLSPEDCFLTREVAQHSFGDFIKSKYLEGLQLKLYGSPNRGARIYADRFRKEVTPQAFYDYSASIVHHSDHCDLPGKFTGLGIPKAFLYGSANNHLSYLARLIDNGVHAIEVSGSGHWPLYDNPSFFYHALISFLRTKGNSEECTSESPSNRNETVLEKYGYALFAFHGGRADSKGRS